MALTKKGNFTFNHADQINDPNWSSEQTKANFDKRAEEMRVAHNGLIDELDSKITEYDANKQDYETHKQDYETHKAAYTTGAHTASNIAVTDTAGNFTATDVEGTLSELFTSVSNGKQKVSTAITGKGGTVADADGDGVPTFTEIASAIDNVASWDADLTPENLRNGVEVFGVTGTLEEGIDTTDATAGAGDILLNKTAYVNDVKVTGSMNNVGQRIITPGTSNIAIPNGYHDGTGYVKGDANLVAGNIKQGKTIFGVSGNVKPDNRITMNGVMFESIGNYEGSYSSAGYQADGSIYLSQRYSSFTAGVVTVTPVNFDNINTVTVTCSGWSVTYNNNADEHFYISEHRNSNVKSDYVFRGNIDLGTNTYDVSGVSGSFYVVLLVSAGSQQGSRGAITSIVCS